MSSRAKRTTAAAASVAASATPTPAAAPAKSKGRRRKAEEVEADDETTAAAALTEADEEGEKSSISVPSSKRARGSTKKPKAPASKAAAAAAAAPSPSALTAAEGLVAGQWSSFLRPSSPLPLRLLFDSVFPLLSLGDLAFRLAATSKAGLAEITRFTDLCKAKQEQDALRFPIQTRKEVHSSPIAPPERFSGPLRVLHFGWFQRTVFTCRFRWLVQSCVIKSMMEVSAIGEMAKRMPWILSLTVCVWHTNTAPKLVLPPRLQHLRVTPARQVTFNDARDAAWTFTAGIFESIATLQHLSALELDLQLVRGVTSEWTGTSDGSGSKLAPYFRALRAPPFAGRLTSLSVHEALASAAIAGVFDAHPRLTTIQSRLPGRDWPEALNSWLADGPSCVSLQSLPLSAISIKDKSLGVWSSSLTSLCPHSWATPDLRWIHAFRELTAVRFEYDLHLGAKNPKIEQIVRAIEQLHKLTDVSVRRYKEITDAQLERMINALPQLTALELHSDCISSLAPLSLHAQLPRQMRRLTIELPKVPRDHIDHVMRLTSLESLSIERSFAEPLYARQLAPFQPPYPREPMHWLRSFTPRGENEPVPVPPVDQAALAVAHAAFGARVREGRVHSAELLTSALLACILQFLDVEEFSFASRTCRSWRAAGSQPSAWGLTPTPVLPSVLVPVDHDDALLSFERPAMIGEGFRGSNRCIELGLASVHLGVLHQSPLWKHARWLALDVHDFADHAPPIGRLTGVGALHRLDTLEANWQLWWSDGNARLLADQEIVQMFERVGPHLLRLSCVNPPVAGIALLSRVEELHVATSQQTDRGVLGIELLSLKHLRKLTVQSSLWHPRIGDLLRQLSHTGSLREVSLDLELEESSARSGETIGSLFEHLANGVKQLEAAAEAAESAAPAVLESLRVVWQHRVDTVLPLAAVLRLPRLRRFELTATEVAAPCDLFDAIEAAVNAGQTLPPIESLRLRALFNGVDPTSLAHLPGLRHLSLVEALWTQNARLTPSCLQAWSTKLPLLEVLALGGFQFADSGLKPLRHLTHLRSLSLRHTAPFKPEDLTTLSQLPALQHLLLEYIPNLTLQPREWMDNIGRPRKEAAAAAAAAVTVAEGKHADEDGGDEMAAAPAGASPDLFLLPVLASMPQLRVFRWEPSDQMIRASAEYTASRSWAPAAVKAVSAAVWQQRAARECTRVRQAMRAMLAERAAKIAAQPADAASPFVPLLIELPGAHARWDALECLDPACAALLSGEEDDSEVSEAQQAAFEDQEAMDEEVAEQRKLRTKAEKADMADPKAKPKTKKKY